MNFESIMLVTKGQMSRDSVSVLIGKLGRFIIGLRASVSSAFQNGPQDIGSAQVTQVISIIIMMIDLSLITSNRNQWRISAPVNIGLSLVAVRSRHVQPMLQMAGSSGPPPRRAFHCPASEIPDAEGTGESKSLLALASLRHKVAPLNTSLRSPVEGRKFLFCIAVPAVMFHTQAPESGPLVHVWILFPQMKPQAASTSFRVLRLNHPPPRLPCFSCVELGQLAKPDEDGEVRWSHSVNQASHGGQPRPIRTTCRPLRAPKPATSLLSRNLSWGQLEGRSVSQPKTQALPSYSSP
ncbi:uncharacterized protein LOC125168466 isoform X2 [Prionailurus viverrinus]|uniref:uncharacterized protein LOC125168466 isoform X2 n=1 Tax=Prionailurus viverrinus TaxID=61388 RepID=UPI001FF262D1|nr:uncharacterized protein LOC125168466 isoform X2 [Prionailurus viverrinus]